MGQSTTRVIGFDAENAASYVAMGPYQGGQAVRISGPFMGTVLRYHT